jgi:Glycosyl transferase family 8
MAYKVFVGVDPRQPLGYNVLQHSIHRYASAPIEVIPLQLRQLPMKRRGLTEFTYSRFLVPYLCGFAHQAIFMDADIVVKGDIVELFGQVDLTCSVQVMQEQPQFEWASVMLFNNGKCRKLTPEFIDDAANILFDLAWSDKTGVFGKEWNHCVGYQEPAEAKLYHYTQGLPCWYETQGREEDRAWVEEYRDMTRTSTWRELMGTSVHAKPVIKRMLERMGVNPA